MALLGIDLGTSSVKVVVLDTQGQTLSVSKADYAVIAPQPGWSESHPSEWWSATVSAVHKTLAQIPQTKITAIGLSGQMHGIVLTDEEGHTVRDAILWADTRAQAEIEQYRQLSPTLIERLGNPLVSGMAGPILYWLAKHEIASYQKARWALQPKDWLRFLLTDEVATEPSDASATLLYDIQSDSWSEEIITSLGLQRALLPPLIPSGTIAGRLSKRAAQALNLPAGLPVAAGAADTASAALGTGLLSPGPIQLTLGTGAQLIQLSSMPIIDSTGRTHLYRAADGANWYAMAAVQNAGLALNWVRQILNATWDEIYASADSISPGADGLLFLPLLTGERPHHPAPSSSGTFLGMRIDHQRQHILHAALEGVAFGIRVAFEALPATSRVTTLRLAGGGSEHPAWRQMLADVLDTDLHTVDTPTASARGAALLAGIASRVWSNAQETAFIAPRTSLVATPSSKRTIAYRSIYTRYLENFSHS